MLGRSVGKICDQSYQLFGKKFQVLPKWVTLSRIHWYVKGLVLCILGEVKELLTSGLCHWLMKLFSQVEGVRGKRPYMTSDRLEDSPSKLLFTSLYRKAEFDMIKSHLGLFPHTLSVGVLNLTCYSICL